MVSESIVREYEVVLDAYLAYLKTSAIRHQSRTGLATSLPAYFAAKRMSEPDGYLRRDILVKKAQPLAALFVILMRC